MLYQNTKAGVLPASVCPYYFIAKRLSAFGVAPNRSVTDIMPRLITPAEVTKIKNILSLFFTYTKSHYGMYFLC